MNEGRRKLVAAVGATAVAVWTRPVVEAVQLPQHAEASPPPRCPPVATYRGLSPIDLPNSGAATELAFVRGFYPPAVALPRLEPGGMAWTSRWHYAVVLVKAGRGTHVFTNVIPGDVLRTPKGISHISPFVCPEDEPL